MRVKIQGIQDADDLKNKLNNAVDHILGLGVSSFTSANLYLNVKSENGSPLNIQNEDGDELTLVIGLPKKKVITVTETDVVKDISKARNRSNKKLALCSSLNRK